MQGGCLCGRIRYETAAPPFHETICHCESCRRATGAPTVAWFSVPRAAFRFIAAQPRSYQSSPHVTRRFCGTCGTSLTYESTGFPDEIDITAATLDDPAAVTPKDHTQVAAKLSWDHIADDLPTYPEFRSGHSSAAD